MFRFNVLNCLDISYRDFWIICYELCFLTRGLDPVYKWNSIKYLIDFWELESLEILSLDWASSLLFQAGYDIVMPCRFLVGFREIGSYSKTRDSCHMSTFGLGRDNATLLNRTYTIYRLIHSKDERIKTRKRWILLLAQNRHKGLVVLGEGFSQSSLCGSPLKVAYLGILENSART